MKKVAHKFFSPTSAKKSTQSSLPSVEHETATPDAFKSLSSRLPWFRSLTFPRAVTEKLYQLGIGHSQLLATHLPHRYEDLSHIQSLKEAVVGEMGQFEVVVRAVMHQRFGRRQATAIEVTDGTAEAKVRFFNLYPAQKQHLQMGAHLRMYGEMRLERGHREFLHPRWMLADRAPPISKNLSPVYSLTTGLTQAALARHIARVLEKVPEEILPMEIVQLQKLPRLKEALQHLHHPPADVPFEWLMSPQYPPRQRCKRDELLALQLLLRRLREKTYIQRAWHLTAQTGDLCTRLLAALPFRLTKAQARVWREIDTDLAQNRPMARLLQGDVGSGKTILALLACCRTLANGHQAVVMAPTEILAEQHYQRFTQLLRPLGITVGWIAASVSNREKRELAALVRQGLINVVVGTHALIEDTLHFSSLALTVIDEQHRFGVQQRLRLQGQDENAQSEAASQPLFFPHQLMMSATPIPRTLAMSHYAHLDVSVLDELPPGRTPIRTRLVNHARRHAIYQFIEKTLSAGQQVYWVCPLIEESESLQLQTATQTRERLRADLPHWASRIGLLHGRMDHEEKQQVMAAFVQNHLALLVSTTVVEVGVDVPNACVMVIENAERFGLAQLHQLRGRVGRGTAQSVCILLFQEPLTEDAKARLKVMFEQNDGFAIAAEDLRIRGPGEIVGDRQSGIPTLRFANLAEDLPLLQNARDLAPVLLRDYPKIADQMIEFWIPDAGEINNRYRA